MRILITGGFGCIGSWIVKDLVERGERVWVFDLREDHQRMQLIMGRDELAKVRFVAGDVADLAAVRRALEGNEISHVIHLAGLQVPACRADPLRGAQVNVVGTLAVFEAVRELGAQVKRIVYASSAAVHSRPEEHLAGPLGDEVRLAPVTHYGAFKVANEANARVYWLDYGILSIGLRPWTVYGVGRDYGLTSAPTKAIKAVVVGQPFHIPYGGLQDLQYVDDVARTFIRALEAPVEAARAYNLRGAVVDIDEFIGTLSQVAPQAAQLVTHGTVQLPISFDLSDERLLAEVGQIPKTPLVEGIRQTVAHFRRLQAEGRLDTSDLAQA